MGWLEPLGGGDDGPGVAALSVLALLAAAPAWDVAEGRHQPAWLVWLVLAAATVLYLAAIRLAFAERRGPATALLALLVAVVALACLAYGGSWFYLFPVAGVAVAVVLTGRRAVRALAAVTALAALLVWRDGGGLSAVLAFGWGTFGAGIVIAVILHLYAVIGELERTRERLAEAAVAEERLRFSRDLHDLLGHTLSVMVVKAEVARRVAARSPEEAGRQATDIERLGRTALAEVRAAVTGYRGRGLAAELDTARATLPDAGVQVTVQAAEVRPAPEVDALLGWAVREATTNVLRHSDATECRISLAVREDGPVLVLEIEDDGPAREAGGGAGHGLDGLAERVAAAGGSLVYGPTPRGGFLVRAVV